MNAFFDQSSAVVNLEASYASSSSGSDDPPFLMNSKCDDYQVRLCYSPPWWKLVERDTSSGVVEAMFRVRGILCLSSLPPVKIRGNQSKKKTTKDLLNMKQMLTITGLGSQSFEKNARQLYDLTTMMHDALSPKDVSPLDAIAYEGHPTIHAQNRYFTERKSAPNLRSLPFLPGVDDNSILCEYNPQEILHSSENRVEYATITNGKKCKRVFVFNLMTLQADNVYVSLLPKFFYPGDLVELVVSLAAVPVKNNKAKLFLVLRGVCLLDTSVRKQSLQATLPAHLTMKMEAPATAKRKMVYLTDDEDEITKRMRKSAVSTDDEDMLEEGECTK